MAVLSFVVMILKFQTDLLWVMGFALMTLWAIVLRSIFGHRAKLPRAATAPGLVCVIQVG